MGLLKDDMDLQTHKRKVETLLEISDTGFNGLSNCGICLRLGSGALSQIFVSSTRVLVDVTIMNLRILADFLDYRFCVGK